MCFNISSMSSRLRFLVSLFLRTQWAWFSVLSDFLNDKSVSLLSDPWVDNFGLILLDQLPEPGCLDICWCLAVYSIRTLRWWFVMLRSVIPSGKCLITVIICLPIVGNRTCHSKWRRIKKRQRTKVFDLLLFDTSDHCVSVFPLESWLSLPCGLMVM